MLAAFPLLGVAGASHRPHPVTQVAMQSLLLLNQILFQVLIQSQ
jgi:hypothetical protein